jgi:hypothetical protein
MNKSKIKAGVKWGMRVVAIPLIVFLFHALGAPSWIAAIVAVIGMVILLAIVIGILSLYEWATTEDEEPEPPNLRTCTVDFIPQGESTVLAHPREGQEILIDGASWIAGKTTDKGNGAFTIHAYQYESPTNHANE